MGFERRGWKTLVSGFPGYRQQYGYGGGGDVQTKSSGGGGGGCSWAMGAPVDRAQTDCFAFAYVVFA